MSFALNIGSATIKVTQTIGDWRGTWPFEDERIDYSELRHRLRHRNTGPFGVTLCRIPLSPALQYGLLLFCFIETREYKK